MRDRYSYCFGRRIFGCAVLLFLLLALTGPALDAFAQEVDVEGVVLSAEDNEPLPGATVLETGTNQGTVTDAEGQFQLTVSDAEASLTVSYVGFVEQTVELDGQAEVTVHLEEATSDLEEVLVTAYGIERERRRLGYATDDLQGTELAEAREINLGDALSGRMAGVSVQSPPTGPAGSSRVVIRGEAALEGNNQPLYVVDGVPLDNRNLGQADEWGGFDGGDALSSLNPDDIESITVLKGASAAALYGSRAQDGAVVITTRGGAQSPGFAVEYDASATFESILVDFDEFQYEYGQGSRGQAPQSQEEALEMGNSSWGAPIEGQDVVQFDGETRPYRAYQDQLETFFQNGSTINNTLSFTQTAEDYNLRLSLSRLDNQGIIPTSGFDRTGVNVRGNTWLGDLYVDARLNYTIEEASFRPQMSDNPANPVLSLVYLPSTIDVRDLEEYKDEEGGHIPFSTNVFRPNPYWGFNENMNEDDQRRVTGFVLGRYHFTDAISLQARAGTDYYNMRRTTIQADGSPWIPQGTISEDNWGVREDNFDLLAQLEHDLTPQIGLTATVGGNIRYEQYEHFNNWGEDFVVPDLRVINNTDRGSRSINYNFNEKQVNALLGTAQFDYEDMFFVELTARNDWSSTLPAENNSYFYPSVNANLVFTEALDLPDVLSSGVVRASWARVGGDTDPYRLTLRYGIDGSHPARDGDEASYGGIVGSEIPLADLQPSQTEGYEGGLDLQFADNRFGLELTLYRQNTINQILGVSVPHSSGFTSRLINAGQIRNEGIEAVLRGRLVQTSDFTWSSTFNWTTNRNQVVELAEGVDSYTLGTSRSGYTFVEARPGEPFGQIVGTSFERNDEGQIVHNEDGLPVVDTEQRVLGNQNPDWTAGWNNTFRYGNFVLNSLIDIRMGGELYSLTNAQAYSTGRHADTVEGREAYIDDPESGGIIGEGVQEDGSPNDVAADPQDYFGRIGGQVSEPFVYDASFVRLRELRLSYTVPTGWLEPYVSGATVSLIGRNLWLLHKNTPNIDPEAGYNVGNAQGLEHASLPSTRSFGLNLNMTF